MNLQAMFQIRVARDHWDVYCREPVKSKEQAQGMLNSFSKRFEEETRVVLEDWDDMMHKSVILEPSNG